VTLKGCSESEKNASSENENGKAGTKRSEIGPSVMRVRNGEGFRLVWPQVLFPIQNKKAEAVTTPTARETRPRPYSTRRGSNAPTKPHSSTKNTAHQILWNGEWWDGTFVGEVQTGLKFVHADNTMTIVPHEEVQERVRLKGESPPAAVPVASSPERSSTKGIAPPPNPDATAKSPTQKSPLGNLAIPDFNEGVSGGKQVISVCESDGEEYHPWLDDEDLERQSEGSSKGSVEAADDECIVVEKYTGNQNSDLIVVEGSRSQEDGSVINLRTDDGVVERDRREEDGPVINRSTGCGVVERARREDAPVINQRADIVATIGAQLSSSPLQNKLTTFGEIGGKRSLPSDGTPPTKRVCGDSSPSPKVSSEPILKASSDLQHQPTTSSSSQESSCSFSLGAHCCLVLTLKGGLSESTYRPSLIPLDLGLLQEDSGVVLGRSFKLSPPAGYRLQPFECDVLAVDPALCWQRVISRSHARFTATNTELHSPNLHSESILARNERCLDLWLEDLGSTNGTFVDGERLKSHEPRRLKPGARIHLGPSGFNMDYVLTVQPPNEKSASNIWC
jgi:hypothetical protein